MKYYVEKKCNLLHPLSCLLPHSFSSRSGLGKCWRPSWVMFGKYIPLHVVKLQIFIVILVGILVMIIGLSDLLVWPINCRLFLTPVKPIPTRDSSTSIAQQYKQRTAAQAKHSSETGQCPFYTPPPSTHWGHQETIPPLTILMGCR